MQQAWGELALAGLLGSVKGVVDDGVRAALGQRQQPYLRVADPSDAELAGVLRRISRVYPGPVQDTSRSPNAKAPAVPALASGLRRRSNSNSSGLEPSLFCALVSAELVGATPGHACTPATVGWRDLTSPLGNANFTNPKMGYAPFGTSSGRSGPCGAVRLA